MRDSSGPHNEPQYSATGVPADAADLTELGAYAATVGNRKIGTTSQRLALTGADVWEGLDYWDTTLNALFRYRSGAWAQVYAGTNLIIPTSVAGGSVSAAGKVTFTTSSSVSVNGAFSSAFDNYRIFIKTTANVSGDFGMKLRAAGVDSSATAYTGQRNWFSNQTGPFTSQQINQSTGWVITAATNPFAVMVFDLVSPALSTEPTSGTVNWSCVGSTVSNGNTGLFYNSNAAFDGFTLTGNSMTGTLTVLGYQNS